MASYQTYVELTYQDLNGDKARVQLPFGPKADTTTLADLATQAGLYQELIGGTAANPAGGANALTNAKLVRAAIQFVTITAHVDPTATTGNRPMDQTYPSVADRVSIGFGSDSGQRTRITIPAVMDKVLLQPPADANANVNQAQVAALAAQAIDATNGLKDPAGNVYGFTLGGRRTLRARKRRPNTNYMPSTVVLG